MSRGTGIGRSMLALFAVLALASMGAAQMGKVKLVYKAVAGQVVRYKSTASISLSAGGQDVTMEIESIEKSTFKAVAPDGNITFERETESEEVKVNGQKLPTEGGEKETSTTIIKPNGALVSYKSAGSEEGSKLAVRMYNASNPVFSDSEVGVGDKWTQEYRADAELGQKAGRAEFEVLAMEKAADADTAKLKMTYRETEGDPAVRATGTVWVEVSSGDTVIAEMEFENVPFGPPGTNALAKAKIKQERVSGSPVGGGKAATPAKPKTIDEVVKDYEKQAGLFTLYRKKEAGRDKLMLEVKEDQLGKYLFLQATASTGTAEAVVAGDPLLDLAFRLEKLQDDRLYMVAPNTGFTAAEGSPIARAVKRGFAEAYLDSFKIEAQQEDRKSLLIDVSDLFLNDTAQIARLLSGGGGISIPGLGGGRSAYTLDRTKTFIASSKVFPENLAVETAYHFSGGAGASTPFFVGGALADPRSVPLRVVYNLWQLKDNGYRPRLADPRVGYFYGEFQDFTDDGAESQIKRWMIRWHLEKADPTAPLSPPKKPIVFWLDNAIPLEHRDAVREGILMWNAAFEKIGFKDAVVVKQQPDDADWDHADMRYNVIRWSTTQSPPYGAVALFRINPLTGEIVNAGITVDAILTRSGKLEGRRIVEPVAHFDRRTERESRPFALKEFNPCRCELAEGAVEQSWFGSHALQAFAVPGGFSEKEYTKDFLRSIVAHEFGHILGLFHNFAASTQFGLDELKNPELLKTRGVVGSVMDYIPFNIAALKRKGVDYWTRTIGPYDFWAVEYGYTPLPGKTPEDELPRLKAIASRGNSPGHAYQNDFFADQFDPAIARFDLGKEPLDYYKKTLQVSRHLLLTLDQRMPRHGESYWDFTRSFHQLLSFYASNAASATSYVGGIHLNRNHRGDPRERPTMIPVDPARQRQALEIVNNYLFSEPALRFPPSFYQKFSPNPTPSFTSFGGSQDFPVLDTISNLQRGALRRLFSPGVMNRIANNEFKSGSAPALTLPVLFRSVQLNVWSELGTKTNISALRRRLQRAHLDQMSALVLGQAGGPEDARMLAWDQLRTLRARLEQVKWAGQDELTRLHVEESLMRVNRTLNATQTLGGASGPAPNLLQLLLGGGDGQRR